MCQKPTPGFMGEAYVQIRKRKKLIDQIRSLNDVLQSERWNKVRQKGLTPLPTMIEFWSQ